MCGVVGLRLKDPALHPVLGELVVPMLDVLASRGPDSTGVAIYRHDASPGALKYSLSAQAADHDWGGYLAALEARAGGVPVELRRRSRDAVVVAGLGAERGPGLLAELDPSVRLFGYGAAMEVYKDVGPAGEVCAPYRIAHLARYPPIAPTPMPPHPAPP